MLILIYDEAFFAFPEWYKTPISLKETLPAMKVGLFLGKMLSCCVLLLLNKGHGAGLIYTAGRLCPSEHECIYATAMKGL